MGIHINNLIPQEAPKAALQRLKDGNIRFISNLKLNRNLLEQVNETKESQQPFAAILSCMDSRTSAELIFDQGLGDIFSIRIAGNIISSGILGSLEYATAVAGAKLILVLGHTGCGAIKGACDNVELGHLTQLIQKIKPSVEAEKKHPENSTGNNVAFVNAVARRNVHNSVSQIMSGSDVIRNLALQNKIDIVPAMYDVTTGRVSFYEADVLQNESIANAELISAE